MTITVPMIASFAVAMLICLFLTPLIKRLALRFGVVSEENDARRMHHHAIPRMGGLGIFIAFFITLVVFNFSSMTAELWGVLLGAFVLIVLGVFDDKFALNPWIKLAVQLLAAVIPTLFGVRLDRLTNFIGVGDASYISLGWLSYPVTVIWIVGLINAVNWIDGLDGLAAGISCISALSMFLVSLIIGDPVVALVLIILAGACMGFLPYNMNPAKIFMGDTGSMFLGYILGTMSILGMFKFYAIVSFAVPFLVVGLPLFDSVFTIVRRLAGGKSPFYADRGHIHHRLIDMGLNTKQAVMILYLVSGALGITAVVLTSSGEFRAMIFVGVLILAVLAAAFIRLIAPHRDAEHHSGHDDDKNS